MNKGLAIAVYRYVLVHVNGWSKEEANKFTFEDMECDPFFEGLINIDDGTKK